MSPCVHLKKYSHGHLLGRCLNSVPCLSAVGQLSLTFLAPETGRSLVEVFSMNQKWEKDGLGMIQAYYVYCALYFYYYYIGSTSHLQTLDLGGWGPYCRKIGERAFLKDSEVIIWQSNTLPGT